jgi:ketosteroid isomerase-like protein
MKKLAMLPATAAFVVTACAPGGGTPEGAAGMEQDAAAHAAIETVMERWAHHIAESQADSLTLLFTEDVRLFPPNAPALQGRSEAQSFFEIVNSVGTFELSARVGAVESSGPLGYAWGTYELTFTPNPDMSGARATEDSGKYVAVLRRVGTEWLIAAQSWNTDLPIRTPMTAAQ